MKQLLYSCILAFLSITTTAQKLNFDAVDKYFAMADSLKQDIPLSDESWNAFLAYKGLQLYINNNALDAKTLQLYKRNFEIAYMPKNDSLLQRRLKEPEKYFLLWVFHNYKTQENELRNYCQQIKANKSAYLDSLYSNCYKMLPKRMHTKATNTTIYFIPIMNDAVAEDHDIVLTLYGAYHFDKLKYGALGAHEIHHVLRKTIKNTQQADSNLYEALTLLLNEGSADLIDKKYTAEAACPIDLKYYDYLMESGPTALALLDTAIVTHIHKTHPITKADLPNIVPMSGHIPGCFMATIIERNGLVNELRSSIDNPIQFLLLYNKAAKMDKEKPYCFSDEVVSFVKEIKQKNSN
jgi:hypothetical protein